MSKYMQGKEHGLVILCLRSVFTFPCLPKALPLLREASSSADASVGETLLLLWSGGFKLMVLLLPGFTIWKVFYCYLVTFPCTFMLIYITVVLDLRPVFFMGSSDINCAALLSEVINLRSSVNYGMGEKGRKPFEKAFDHSPRQNNQFFRCKSEASIPIGWCSLLLACSQLWGICRVKCEVLVSGNRMYKAKPTRRWRFYSKALELC